MSDDIDMKALTGTPAERAARVRRGRLRRRAAMLGVMDENVAIAAAAAAMIAEGAERLDARDGADSARARRRSISRRQSPSATRLLALA